MNSKEPLARVLPRRRGRLSLAALAVPLVFSPAVFALDQPRNALPVKNAQFAPGETQAALIPDWVFEEKEPEASLVVPENGAGVVLEAGSETARGDLISTTFQLQAFRVVEVTVQYVVESGDPLLFVCLWPTDDPARLSLDFLPQGQPGVERSAKVRAHTGRDEGDYALALSITGRGTARLLSVEACHVGAYPTPDKPLLVLDIMFPEANPEVRAPSYERLAAVFGFPSVEYVHFTELTRSKLAAIDPALIILPGISQKFLDAGVTNAHVERIFAAIRTVLDHGAPVVGLCFGHQMLAAVNGASGGRGPEWGPIKINIVRPDAIFDGLPRAPFFYAAGRHNGIVTKPPNADVIASTDICKAQLLRYKGKPWYSCQCHLESDWESTCPEAYLLFRNMFRQWGLAPQMEAR
jgi:GMP synthase-like glutamine amidotransferase